MTSAAVYAGTVKSAVGQPHVEHQQPLALSDHSSDFYLRSELRQRISYEPDDQDRVPFTGSIDTTWLCPGPTAVGLLSLRNTQLLSAPHFSLAVARAPPAG